MGKEAVVTHFKLELWTVPGRTEE